MKNNNILFLSVVIILALNIISCSNTTGPDQSPVLRITEPPTITGFYITTNNYPDGTGEKIGNPSYTIKKINVFPNPFDDNSSIEELNKYNGFITFNHLPRKVTIIIVKGRTLEEASNSSISTLGIPAAANGVWKVKTLTKDDPSQFTRWDLHDENREWVPKGYYRIYFYGEGVPDNYWLDVSVDPTPFANWNGRF